MRASVRTRTTPRRRVLRAVGLALLAAVGAVTLAVAKSTDWFASLGGRLSGERLDRARRSGHWSEGRFHNAEPTGVMTAHDIPRSLRLQFTGGEVRYPTRPIPVVPRSRADYDAPPATGLRVTWIGHATALIEIDGQRILTDPIWSERGSPSTLLGPKRFFAPPLALDDLPPIDAVLVSHDHYDHLDMETARALSRRGVPFLVPLGIGAHLEKWGVPAAQIRELDWGDETRVGDLKITAAAARHFSGRSLADRDATLWCSFVVAGPRHRIFYSGDSGYFPGYRRIGEAYGPFDATLISLGSYGPTWPDIHMNPEEVVQAHVDLGGGVLLPVHWATFNLAFHAWNEPAARAAAEAERQGVRIVIPRPGQFVEPSAPPPPDDWWRRP